LPILAEPERRMASGPKCNCANLGGTPAPTTPGPTPDLSLPADAETELAASADALFDSSNEVIPVKVGLAVPSEAFIAMKAAAQASAISLRDGFADTAGRPRHTVVIPTNGINPPIGDFVLVYKFGRMLSEFDGRELSDFSGTLNVEFNVAVPPAESAAMTTSLTALKDSAAQLTSLTSAINNELASNVGVAAVVTGATVEEIKPVFTPTSTAAPTPTPKDGVEGSLQESFALAAALVALVFYHV
jgi:hypothetical protein